MTNTSLFYIIIRKFGYYKKFYLVILRIIDKSSKIDFYYIIFLLGLSVCLWVEGVGKFLLDTKKII